MPYTASHAIAVFPLWAGLRRWLPLPALVVGSLSPDFPYFVALTPIRAPGHFLDGLLLWCVLPSLIVLGIWYRWLEKPTLALLRLRAATRHENRIADLAALVFGATLGALTHNVWDASSHDYGWIVDRYAWLRSEALGLPLFQWNQFVSSVVGLIALAAWYWSSRTAATPQTPGPREYRVAAGITAALTLGFTGLALVLYEVRSFEDLVVQASVGAFSGAALSIVAYSVWANRQTAAHGNRSD